MWSKVVDFDDGRCNYPEDSGHTIVQARSLDDQDKASSRSKINEQCLTNIDKKKNTVMKSVEFKYTEKDILLYSKRPGCLSFGYFSLHF